MLNQKPTLGMQMEKKVYTLSLLPREQITSSDNKIVRLFVKKYNSEKQIFESQAHLFYSTELLCPQYFQF